ncbi:oxygen-independent coproporphyrinogen III oxidase [Parvularcula oceani]|uniref:oxygen-independent coproporphyrinogen III oxidase n=1 Tax=Parvularcula oceani TaxID=1247963 RepID=UPI0004E20C7D|nr:oxygen-independent coproporphyrinogen III oxidase [Parvularcula oceani]
MKAFHAGLAEAAVPRYTSFPPANRFRCDVAPADHAGWLGALSAEDRVSLYVHVPFCRSLCWYCGCNTHVTRHRSPVRRFRDAVLEEMRLVEERLSERPVASALHFGGGSPDMLTAEDVRLIGAGLRRIFGFSDNAEIAAELDPRGVSAPLVSAFADAGVTRASFGIQTTDEAVQRRIGRVQFPATIRHAVRMLAEGGIADWNADLLYGLPGQAVRHVREDCRFVASLGASRVAVFGYAHVPWFKKHQQVIDEALLPGAAERFAQAEAAAEELVAAGYERIGFDHFALPDDPLAVAARERRLKRNFQGFTPDDATALIGFGPSAISRLPQGYVQNETTLKGYYAAVGEGSLPTARGHHLTAEERRRGALIERLLCDGGVDLPDWALAEAACGLTALRGRGIVDVADGRLTVTEAGRPYARNVAAALDREHRPAPQAHARAV